MATFSSTDFKSSQIPASDYLPPSSGSGSNIDNSFTSDGVSPGKSDNPEFALKVTTSFFEKGLDFFIGGGGPGGYFGTGEGYGPFSGGKVDVPDLENFWDLIKPILAKLKSLMSVFWGVFEVGSELLEGIVGVAGIVYTSAKYKDNQQLSDADAAPILKKLEKVSFDFPKDAYLTALSLRLGNNGKLYADHGKYDQLLQYVGMLLTFFVGPKIGVSGVGAVKAKGIVAASKSAWAAITSLSFKGLMEFVGELISGFKAGGTIREGLTNLYRVAKGRIPTSSTYKAVGKETLSQVEKGVGNTATKATLEGVAKAIDTIPASVKAELEKKVVNIAVVTPKMSVAATAKFFRNVAVMTSLSASVCYGSLVYINKTQNKGWTEREIMKNAIWQGYSFALALIGAKGFELLLGRGMTVGLVVSETLQYLAFTAAGGSGDNAFADALHKVFESGPYSKTKSGDEEPITQNTGGMIKGLNKRSKR